MRHPLFWISVVAVLAIGAWLIFGVDSGVSP